MLMSNTFVPMAFIPAVIYLCLAAAIVKYQINVYQLLYVDYISLYIRYDYILYVDYKLL